MSDEPYASDGGGRGAALAEDRLPAGPLRTFAPLLAAAALLPVFGAGVATFGGATSPPPEADRVARLTRTAEQLRGVRLTRPVTVERLDRGELSSLIATLLAREPDPAQSAGADDALHLMGVLGPDQHAKDVLTAGLEGQVAGVYDPRTDRLSLVETGGIQATDSTVLHEIVHAIQDQRYDLEGQAFRPRPADADREAAAQAVVEGDATEVQTRFLLDSGLGGLLGELGGSIGQLQGATAEQLSLPGFLQRSLEFPYLEGQAFIEHVRDEAGEAGVDRAFRVPPATTLGILDPQRYLDRRDRPVAVAAPEVPAGARRVFDTTFGAADVLALTGDRDLALTWRGGRGTVDRAGTSAALTLRVVTTEPDRLAGALRDALPPTTVVSADGGVVTAINRAELR